MVGGKDRARGFQESLQGTKLVERSLEQADTKNPHRRLVHGATNAESFQDSFLAKERHHLRSYGWPPEEEQVE